LEGAEIGSGISFDAKAAAFVYHEEIALAPARRTAREAAFGQSALILLSFLGFASFLFKLAWGGLFLAPCSRGFRSPFALSPCSQQSPD
jgi:hypothetical protein